MHSSCWGQNIVKSLIINFSCPNNYWGEKGIRLISFMHVYNKEVAHGFKVISTNDSKSYSVFINLIDKNRA